MRLAAEGAQHVDGRFVGARQLAAVAHPHHLRAARLVGARCAGQVAQIFGVGGIGDVDDRRAVGLGLAGHGIDRVGNLVGAAVMADIGDPAVALMMDRRLVGAAGLQVAPAGQPHVGGFRRRADLLLLGVGRTRGDQETDDEQRLTRHGISSGFAAIIQHRVGATPKAVTYAMAQPGPPGAMPELSHAAQNFCHPDRSRAQRGAAEGPALLLRRQDEVPRLRRPMGGFARDDGKLRQPGGDDRGTLTVV